MSKALTYYNSVTFHLSRTKMLYSSLTNRMEWPKDPFKVMDIGCGPGSVLMEVLEPILPRHYQELVGTDISQDMVDVCKQLTTDPRISFEVMNIESETLPNKFHNSFDFLFSSFTLQYVRDLRRALHNCHRLLKPGGQLGFIFLHEIHPLYEIYRRLYAKEEWKPYTKQFENYAPILKPNNTLQDLKMNLNQEKFDMLWAEFNSDPSESLTENFLKLFTSVDTIHPSIPQEKRAEYEIDFAEALSEILNLSMRKRDLKKTVKACFPIIVVHAKKGIIQHIH